MKTPYIVWLNPNYDRETLSAASKLLGGYVYEGSGDVGWLLETVNNAPRLQGFGTDVVSMVMPLETYIREENLHGITPDKQANKYTVAVYTEKPLGCTEWMEFFRREDFHHRVNPDYCREVFVGVLHGSGDLTYDLFREVCANYGGVSEDDPPLLLRNSPVAGYTDIAYLLKDCDGYRPEEVPVLLQQLEPESLRWLLYARNVEAVNCWMGQTKLDLWAYTNDAENEKMLFDDVFADVVCNWARDVVCQVEYAETE